MVYASMRHIILAESWFEVCLQLRDWQPLANTTNPISGKVKARLFQSSALIWRRRVGRWHCLS